MHSNHQLHQIWIRYPNKWPQEYQSRISLTFGTKVGQLVLIEMKLELDMWRHLLDIYDRFEIDISKDAEKNGKLLFKSKTRKNSCLNSENKIFGTDGTYVEKYAEATYVPNLKHLSWFMRPWLQNNEFDLISAVK